MALTGSQRVLIGVILVGAMAIPLLWRQLYQDHRPTATMSWDATIAAMDQDPDRLLAFLAERTFVRDGRWDFRWMSEPFRHLWATLRFERGLGPSGPDTPTFDEVAMAYRAFALEDVGELVVKLERALAEGTRNPTEARACEKALAEARPRIMAARKSYMQAHRTELDTN